MLFESAEAVALTLLAMPLTELLKASAAELPKVGMHRVQLDSLPFPGRYEG
jgi:hypothetical protein